MSTVDNQTSPCCDIECMLHTLATLLADRQVEVHSEERGMLQGRRSCAHTLGSSRSPTCRSSPNLVSLGHTASPMHSQAPWDVPDSSRHLSSRCGLLASLDGTRNAANSLSRPLSPIADDRQPWQNSPEPAAWPGSARHEAAPSVRRSGGGQLLAPLASTSAQLSPVRAGQRFSPPPSATQRGSVCHGLTVHLCHR